jgi:hypothetical protein
MVMSDLARAMQGGIMIPRFQYSIHQQLGASKGNRAKFRHGRSGERWGKPNRHWSVSRVGRYQWP